MFQIDEYGSYGFLVSPTADDNFARWQRLRDIYDPDRRFFDFYAQRAERSTASDSADVGLMRRPVGADLWS